MNKIKHWPPPEKLRANVNSGSAQSIDSCFPNEVDVFCKAYPGIVVDYNERV